jgi:hypothetical protein
MTLNIAEQRISAGSDGCSPAERVTKSLLGYGVTAGPVYVTVALVQASTRDGFDLSRHPWSMLANGEHGWIQVTNFALTGLTVIAFAVGGIGFTCLAIAGFVVARRFTAEGRPGWARYSRATAVVFLAGFVLVAAGGGARVANLGFTAAVTLTWAWMTAVSLDRYGIVARKVPAADR